MKKSLLIILLCASSLSAQPIMSIGAGELSPLLKYRVDFDKRYLGVQTLENMLVRPQGTAIRRPGMYYIADTKNNERVRLTSFTFSTDDAYILEWGDLYVRFYRNGGQILDGGDPYEVTTTYTTAQLQDLHFVQSLDVLYIFHPDVAPRKLSRTDHTDWTIADVDWLRGPFDDENTGDTTITPSAATGTTTLTASTAIFTANHVGAKWQVTHTIEGAEVSASFTSVGNSSTVDVRHNQQYEFTTHGTWSGTIKLQRSYDSGSTYEDVLVYNSANDRNASYPDAEENGDAIYRVRMDVQTGGSCRYSLITYTHDVDGVIDITAFSTTKIVVGTVEYELGGTSATTRWAEGAWSNDNGWPRTGCFYQDRLIIGGNEELPVTVWISQTGDYENMLFAGEEDDAIVYEIAGAQQNPIVWLFDGKGIIVGTSGSIMRIASTNSTDEGLTFKNISSNRISSTGSTTIQPVGIGEQIIFIDRDKQRVRALAYDLQSDGYIAPDLTILAEHISDPCFLEIAVQQSPDPIVWLIRRDGTVCSMTFDPDQNVIAWARHPMLAGGDAESESTDPGYYTAPEYPILQELADDEIPDAPTAPTETTADTAVSNATQLEAMSGSTKYYLTTDIDLDGVDWTPITGFTGVFDGRGFTLSNLTIDAAASDYQAMFGTVGDGVEMRDVTLTGFDITGDDWVSCLIASHGGDGTIQLSDITVTDCTVTADSSGSMILSDAGDITGGDIRDITITGCTIVGIDNNVAGMLIGELSMRTSPNSASDVNIVDCVITNCSIAGSNHDLVGGMAGFLEGDLDNGSGFHIVVHGCTADCDITFTSTDNSGFGTGGFVAKVTNSLEITNCSSSGTLTIVDDGSIDVQAVAGFVGFDESNGDGSIGGSIQYVNCFSTVDISIESTISMDVSLVGGFIGKYDTTSHGSILRCYSTGDITITGITTSSLLWYVGGFMGGAIFGSRDGIDIQRSWATGDISISHTETFGSSGLVSAGIGGFMGEMVSNSEITESEGTGLINCYTWSSISINTDVIDTPYIAGFIGYVEFPRDDSVIYTFENFYSAQTDTAAGSGLTNQLPMGTEYSVGGMNVVTATGGDGAGSSVIVNSGFWDNETSEATDDSYTTEHTTDWLQTKSNFTDAGWDFDDIWDMPTPFSWKVFHSASGHGGNSVAVIPGNGEDEVWFATRRIINDTSRYMVEQMQPQNWGSDQNDIFFVDCGLTYDGVETTTLTGLDHLNYEEVQICGDGGYFQLATVSAGSVTLNEGMTVAHVGLAYTSTLVTFPIEVGQSLGLKKRMPEVVLAFYKTLLCEYGLYGGDMYPILFDNSTLIYGGADELFTGYRRLGMDTHDSEELEIHIRQTQPFPMAVTVIVPRMEIAQR